MSTTTIENVEAFATGTHNGLTFDTADLDAMVTAFNELSLANKLPVKIGHAAADTQPAMGWISALRREGGKLLASLAQVPSTLIDSIKEGRFRHVSIELLKGVKHGGKEYRWVPDGLAVLGAARPAVASLRGLHELVARAMPGLAFTERLAFSYSGHDELAELRATVAKQHQQLLMQAIEADLGPGGYLPAVSHGFRLSRGLTDDPATWSATTASDWAAFSRMFPKQPAREREIQGRQHLADYQLARVQDAGAEFSAKFTAIMREENLNPADPVQVNRGQRLTHQRHPELGRAWLDQPGKV